MKECEFFKGGHTVGILAVISPRYQRRPKKFWKGSGDEVGLGGGVGSWSRILAPVSRESRIPNSFHHYRYPDPERHFLSEYRTRAQILLII